MGLEEIWDSIVDEFMYFISFEWFSDVGEFFSGLFENLNEFSPIGMIYGFIMVIMLYVFRKQVFVFVDSMSIGGKIFWYPVLFIFGFAIAYIMGRKAWE